MSIYLYSSIYEIPSRKAALVLGAPEYYRGRANPVLLERIQAAAELYHAGKIQALVVSGISRPNEFYDEVSSMCEALIAFGVPQEAIIKDNKSFRTLESIQRMHDFFGYDDFIIISQREHCKRALFLAAYHGIIAIGLEAKNPQDLYADETLEAFVREPLARIKAIIDIAINRQAKYPSNQ